MKKIYLLILTIILSNTVSYGQVPDFTETDCNGVTHHLYDELAAGNAVILNFCAGWCGPCRQADPKLEEVFQATCSGTGKVKVYGMLFQTNVPGEPTDCNFGNKYASDYNLTFPIFTDVQQLDDTYELTYGINSIPVFYIIIPNIANPANSTVIPIVGNLPDLKEQIFDALATGGFYPDITVTGDLCSAVPAPVTLSSNFSTGNLWSTGSTSQSITVGATGLYSLTVTNNGCSETTYQYIEFNPLPVAGTASISTTSACVYGTIVLDYNVPAGSTDLSIWQQYIDGTGEWVDFASADLGPIPLFSADPPGTILKFRVKAVSGYNYENQSSCIAYSNEVTVTINSNLPGPASGVASTSSTAVCYGSYYTLNYSGNEPSFWQIFDEFSGGWFDFSYAHEGPIDIPALYPGSTVNGLPGDKFRVRVDGSPCGLVSNVVEVQYLPSPEPPIISVTGDLCTNAAPLATLSSDYPTGNLWSTGATTQSITVTTTDTYSLTVNLGTCSVTVSEYIEFNPIPVAGTATINTTSACPGASIVLDYNPPAGFSGYTVWGYSVSDNPGDWYFLDFADYGPIEFLVPNQPGVIYSFIVVALSGFSSVLQEVCITESNEVTLTINNDLPGPVSGTASSSVAILCTGSEYTINYTGNEPDAIWQWLDESTGEWNDFEYASQGPIDLIATNPSSTINGLRGERIRVIVKGSPCWKVSNVIEIQYLPTPDKLASITPIAGECAPVILNSAYATGNVWSTGDTSRSIIVTSSDLISLTVTLGTCSYSSAYILPAGAPSNDNLCNAKPLALDSTVIFSNICATTQSGEMVPPAASDINNSASQDGWNPDNFNYTVVSLDNTVWFSFIAPNSGAVAIETYGFDTQLALYSSSNNKCTGVLSRLAANDDGGTDYGSLIFFSCLQKGKKYFVQVDGWYGQFGVALIGVFNIPALPAPSSPAAINGLTGTVYGYCNGGTYTFSTSSADATSFNWSVSGGTILSGQGTNTISIKLGNNYDECEIKVKGINCKGTSSQTKLKLKSVLPKPSISGASSACKNGNTVKTYTVSGASGATSFTWSSTTSTVKFSDGGVPANPLTTAAASVTVDFAGVSTGNRAIKVTANNTCGSSKSESKNVTVSNCLRISSEAVAVNESTLLVYPNPAREEVNISLNSISTATYSIKVVSMTGQVVLSDVKNVIEGENKFLINLSNIASGLYTVILYSDSEMMQTRIVKE